jgi:hypothetical protein
LAKTWKIISLTEGYVLEACDTVAQMGDDEGVRLVTNLQEHFAFVSVDALLEKLNTQVRQYEDTKEITFGSGVLGG